MCMYVYLCVCLFDDDWLSFPSPTQRHAHIITHTHAHTNSLLHTLLSSFLSVLPPPRVFIGSCANPLSRTPIHSLPSTHIHTALYTQSTIITIKLSTLFPPSSSLHPYHVFRSTPQHTYTYIHTHTDKASTSHTRKDDTPPPSKHPRHPLSYT